MCGRLSQYRGIHDFVETLSLPEAWRNNVGDQPLGRYNVAPTTPVAVLRVDDTGPRADLVRWGGDRIGRPTVPHRSTPGSKRWHTALSSGRSGRTEA